MAPKLDGSALISALKQLDFQVRVISFLNYTYWYNKTCKGNHAKTDQPKYFSLGTRILQPNYGRAKMCGGHVLCIYRSKYVCFVLLQWTCYWSWKWCLFSLERHEFKGKDTFICTDMSGAVKFCDRSILTRLIHFHSFYIRMTNNRMIYRSQTTMRTMIV